MQLHLYKLDKLRKEWMGLRLLEQEDTTWQKLTQENGAGLGSSHRVGLGPASPALPLSPGSLGAGIPAVQKLVRN